MSPATSLPSLLQPRASDELQPPRLKPEVWARYVDHVHALGLDPQAFAVTRQATAAALDAIDQAHGGGFYDVPRAALRDDTSATEWFDDRGGPPVVDVQTHLVVPSRWSGRGADALASFLRDADPERWGDGIDPERISAAQWAASIFGASETAVAVLTSPPGMPGERVLHNSEIAAARDIVERYSGTGRVLSHAIVHPNLPDELAAMPEWAATLEPAGWKTYTLWEPRGTNRGGWFLDDEQTGIPFLEQVRACGGPRRVAVHKGIAGPIPDLAPAGASPRDIGPAAAAYPDLTFLVYHSGYDQDHEGQEGPHQPGGPYRGVSRLVESVTTAGIGPGGNVYAELGSTWFLMLRRPVEAAHVLGKLLKALGPRRILWGTDCVWYGSPQPLIDAFRRFTIPAWMRDKYGYPELTNETKRAILSTNAISAYGLAEVAAPEQSWVEAASAELRARLA